MKLDEIVAYVLTLLCGKQPSPISEIAYCHPGDALYRGQRILIVPSRFFVDGVYGTPASLPALPLNECRNVPLLFGQPKVERVLARDGKTRLIIHADIIASAYFMLTRYEEIVRRSIRDEHGRFPGRESLPYRAGFLHRPIVDEYAALLRKWLRQVGVNVPEPPQQISKIFLTHDVDVPWAWYGIRSVAKATLTKCLHQPSQALHPMLSYFGKRRGVDPNDCFDWILHQDTALREALETAKVAAVLFLLVGSTDPHDGPCYLGDRRTRQLVDDCRRQNVQIGLHSSYKAGREPARIPLERRRLQEAANASILWNRHHFLSSREPEHFACLESAGITDDFTMGYADLAGFRLGTCRPVHWFDPVALRLSNLTLHPLTVMECTLDKRKYMNLNYEQAQAKCFSLLSEVRKRNGEAVLLWHNTELADKSVQTGNYQRKLYVDVLRYLRHNS